MKLWVVVIATILCQREITVEGQMEGRANDVGLFVTGTDKLGGMSTTEQHAAFTVTKPRALEFGRTFRDLLSRQPLQAASRQGFSGLDGTSDLVPPEICPGIFRCNPRARFRTADGSCNNLGNPHWGKSFLPMRRFLPPEYDDGIKAPRTKGKDGTPLMSARGISRVLHTADTGSSTELKSVSHMAMQWAQFLDHDITNAPIERGVNGSSIECCPEELTPAARSAGLNNTDRPECFTIDIPPGDRRFTRTCMNFVRSIQGFTADCRASTTTPVEQLNQLTAYVDGSQVYESDEENQIKLRLFRGGLLKTSQQNPELLPEETESPTPTCVTYRPPNYCFRAGDERVDEHTALATMHTIWLREHNRIARALARINPFWDDERLFQESRKIVGAMIQHITYTEFLPIVLAKQYLRRYKLLPSRSYFSNVYDRTVDASIRNSFAAAAYRFGHSMIRSWFSKANKKFGLEGNILLRNSFGNTSIIISSNGDSINKVTRGLVRDRAFSVDRFATPEVSDFLFLDDVGNSLDLMSLNIQRGRDHGIPGYNAWREWCGLPRADNFGTRYGGLVDHPDDAARELGQLYNDPDDIDLFSGGVSERAVRGGLLGRTFSCIVSRQFMNIKVGDRFWYENFNRITGFTPFQLYQIRNVRLSRVICDNTDTVKIHPSAFRKSPYKVSCSRFRRLDLRWWREIRRYT